MRKKCQKREREQNIQLFTGKKIQRKKNRYSMREKYVNTKDEKMQNQKFFEKNEKRREKII